MASSISRALRARLRLLAALLLLLGASFVLRARGSASGGGSTERGLATILLREGLAIDPSQVAWLRATPDWLGVRPALVLARTRGEPRDVYHVDVRIAGSTIVGVSAPTNLTRTSSADEDRMLRVGERVAYTAKVGDGYDAFVLLDTRGEPASMTAGWPWLARLQNAVTNLQDTGRFAGFGVRRYELVNPTKRLVLSRRGATLVVHADDAEMELPPSRAKPTRGADLVALDEPGKGQPGLVTWVVDTVRRVPWIGRAPVEWLEHAVFGLTDRASRAYHEVVRTDAAAAAKEALAVNALPGATPPSPAAPETLETGFPPPPIEPVLDADVAGEGRWIALRDDPFVTQASDGSPLFYQTFVRVDPERTFASVYVTLWDPRRLQLGVVMGTKEPESATGETGKGYVPRDPFTISHLVAAFNGGFQALHGEFGMMADGRVYLPPKPYAATVAVFEDGRVGIGSWPGPGRRAWDEALANSQIPRDMLAMRQNLTSVVEGDVYNPWKRWWWGAAPEWAGEQTYIPRSGLCLTREGFLAFLWGESMGPEELGKAMLAARCVRGLHLDMNGKHTGLELYRSHAPGTRVQDLGRAPTATESDAVLPELLGYRFRARLAVTTMTPLRFPRYLSRDPRDFFYLVRRPELPGAPLRAGERVAPFTTSGVPDTGYPQAFARATLPDTGVTLLRIDASRALPRPLAPASLTRVVARLDAESCAAEAAVAQVALLARYVNGLLRLSLGQPGKGTHVLCRGARLSERTSERAALGVDQEGLLVYAEGADGRALIAALAAAGVTEAMALGEGRLHLLADGAAAVPEGDLELVAETRPAAEILFPEVTPKPYRHWGWLQDQRVRYFPSGPARFPTPATVQ